MSWSSVLTPSYLRLAVGNTDGSYDTELQFYINSLLESIETETRIDTYANPSNSISEIFTYDLEQNIFVLNGRILQPSAWQSITNLEISDGNSTPTYTTLVVDQDYSLVKHTQRPYPIFQIKFLSNLIRNNQKVRITGLKGFSLDTNIPAQIVMFLVTCVSAYYSFLVSGGIDGQMVETEKDLTSSVTISSTAFDTWKSTKLFTPNQIAEFLKLLASYNTNSQFPY